MLTAPFRSTAKSLAKIIPILFVLICVAAEKAPPKYITPDQFDLKTILGDPPADDSAVHQAEIVQLLKFQDDRTSDDVTRAKSEAHDSPFLFAEVLGGWFDANELPQTDAFLKQVYSDTKAISAGAKKIWNRQRPFLADPRIKCCVEIETTSSYPSGHATRGVVLATVLSEIFPEYREKLMARGKLIGHDRLIAGIHFPSDVDAGQKLGAVIAAKMLADPKFKEDLEKVKAECLAGVHK